ncbi:uncharacterized protein CEXT_109401 [Caerostris extrusa]|uniref:DUF4590 domain-containing protein n=1 Tax=Caerostris extrusa TaxID=172846 RepID=A0AAV4XAC9_CAEEX|nr:uncharacterized protein CEXT_109401 [Caerostris extrusa]
MENVEKIKGGSRRKMRSISYHGSLKNSLVPILFQEFTDIDFYKHEKICERNVPSVPRSAPTTNRKSFKSHVSNLRTNISKLKRCFSAKEASPYVFPLHQSNNFTSNSRNAHRHTSISQKKKKLKKNVIDVEPKNSSSVDTATSKITKLSIPDQNFNINQCKVTLYYHGHTPLTNSQTSILEEVLIRQQHCGGTPVIIYKGQISPNETLTFMCLDHNGFTFSITLFLDGIRYLKLSSCCVFRYSPGRRLGGSSGCFTIQDIQGGKPCLKCQYRHIETEMHYKQKFDFSSLENSRSLQMDDVNQASNFNEKNFMSVVENTGSVEEHVDENHTEEDIASSVASEIIHSPPEEIEENSEIADADHDTILDNEVSEDIIDHEDKNVSVEENLNVESSYYSDSSGKSESGKNIITGEFHTKLYESESSDEDDVIQEHVVIASVHGSPN